MRHQLIVLSILEASALGGNHNIIIEVLGAAPSQRASSADLGHHTQLSRPMADPCEGCMVDGSQTEGSGRCREDVPSMSTSASTASTVPCPQLSASEHFATIVVAMRNHASSPLTRKLSNPRHLYPSPRNSTPAMPRAGYEFVCSLVPPESDGLGRLDLLGAHGPSVP